MSTSVRTRSSMASFWAASQSKTKVSVPAGAVIVPSFRRRFEKNTPYILYSIILPNRKARIGHDNSAQACAGTMEHGCVLIRHCGCTGSGAILTERRGFGAGAADDPGAGDAAPRHGRFLLRRRPGGPPAMGHRPYRADPIPRRQATHQAQRSQDRVATGDPIPERELSEERSRHSNRPPPGDGTAVVRDAGGGADRRAGAR